MPSSIVQSTVDGRYSQDALAIAERKLAESQVEWNERLARSTETTQESIKEAKRACLELESEREKTAKLSNDIEELRLEIETIKLTSASREKFFQKEVEDFRSKLRRKDLELSKVRETTSADLAEIGEKCRKLVVSLDEKQHVVTGLTDQLKTVRDEKNCVESQIETERKDRERAQKYCADLERRNEDLLAREQQLEAKCRHLEDDIESYRSECDHKQRTVCELEDAVLAAKRAGAEVAISNGERDRAFSNLLEENNRLKAKMEDAAVRAVKSTERLRDLRQQLSDKEHQINDANREIETQREYCRTLKMDLQRAQEQRENAFVEHEILSKQLVDFRAMPICQNHLPSVQSNDFASLKQVVPFIREKLDHYDKLMHDLNQAKAEVSNLSDQKRDLVKTCREKDVVVSEVRASLEQAMAEIEKLRGTLLDGERKQETATMRAARTSEQLHREQTEHEKTLSLLRSAEAEVSNTEQRFAKALHKMLATMVNHRCPSQQAGPLASSARVAQLLPLVQKELANLIASNSRFLEQNQHFENELASSNNNAKARESELRQLQIEADTVITELRNQLESEKTVSARKIDLLEQKLRADTSAFETRLSEISQDREELRNHFMRIDSSKVELEGRLSQALSNLDQAKNENRILTAASGVLLSALVNTLRRLSALIMGAAVLRMQVAASEVFRMQLQNLLNSLASTAGIDVEKTMFTIVKPKGIFAFRKAVICVLAANRFSLLANRSCHKQGRRTLVLLPAGSCRQIGCTVGLDMLPPSHLEHDCDELAFVCWLTGEDFAKRFLALGSLLSLPDSLGAVVRGDNRFQSALRSSLRCILTSAVECFDPHLIPSPNRPQSGSKQSLVYLLGNGLRFAFNRHRQRYQPDGNGGIPFQQSGNNLPVYSFQVIFDSICAYWQRLTDQLVVGWQQQRSRLQSDLADAQRQLAIYRPDVESMRKQLEMSVPQTELETACGELASALDREKQLQVAVTEQTRKLERLTEENAAFTKQHSGNTAIIAAKHAEVASLEARLSELIETNDKMQGVAADAENMVTRAAVDRRWACDYVKQVESLAVRWASKLSRLYTDQVEFRKFYGELHGLGAHAPGGRHSRNGCAEGVIGKVATMNGAFHASQACIRLTRTFLHLFDHARKYAQSMADNNGNGVHGLDASYSVDELASWVTSKAVSASSLNSYKRSPRSKQRSRNHSSHGSKSFNTSPRDNSSSIYFN